MKPGTRFKPVLSEDQIDKAAVCRVVLLTGKIYYDLAKQRNDHVAGHKVSFIRLEELSPFPFSQLKKELKSYPNATEFVWLQEEPRNQGAWTHVSARIDSVLDGMGKPRVRFTGRKESAVPAPGSGKIYAEEQKDIIESAFLGL
jgi:probable 2-oxoglutarate dehydrogenase E1 component DHKTD1